jgi:hypothetical protein
MHAVSAPRLLALLRDRDPDIWRQGAELCQSLGADLPEEVFLSWQARELRAWLPLRHDSPLPTAPPPLCISTPAQLQRILVRVVAFLPLQRSLVLRSHACSREWAEGCFALQRYRLPPSQVVEDLLTLRLDATGLSLVTQAAPDR